MQAVIDFVMSHMAVLAGLLVAVLDLVFALNSKAESNGVLHWIYMQVKALAKKDVKPE